jgi:hypothetical protein
VPLAVGGWRLAGLGIVGGILRESLFYTPPDEFQKS